MMMHRTLSLILIVALILTPSINAFAQDGDEGTCVGTGIFYWPCRLLDGLLSLVSSIFNWIGNALSNLFQFIGHIFSGIATFLGNLFNAVINFFQSILSFFASVLQLIWEAIQIGALVVQIIFGLIAVLGAWLFQAVNIVTTYINEFFGAAPAPLPGLPQCISAPTDHDLCAVWYMLDNTVWSNSPGDLLVLIIIICIDVAIVFWFIRSVLGYIRMGENVTNVG